MKSVQVQQGRCPPKLVHTSPHKTLLKLRKIEKEITVTLVTSIPRDYVFYPQTSVQALLRSNVTRAFPCLDDI